MGWVRGGDGVGSDILECVTCSWIQCVVQTQHISTKQRTMCVYGLEEWTGSLLKNGTGGGWVGAVGGVKEVFIVALSLTLRFAC